MPDRLFTEINLAALYDLMAPPDRRSDFAFYLPMVMSAESVLDVGCGTGALLHRARIAGHTGRLCGVDPAPGMLEQASKWPDIDWILGDLTSASWKSEFDLIVMTGHAFQVFVEDETIRSALMAIHSALTANGNFVFETRNPSDRAWERWNEEYSVEVTDDTGTTFRNECVVESPVEGDLVHFSHTFSSSAWERSEVSHSTLRFLDERKLASFLVEAGLAVLQQYGDWDRSPLTDTSLEIITVAGRAESQSSA